MGKQDDAFPVGKAEDFNKKEIQGQNKRINA
jgi:hypothetical protein